MYNSVGILGLRKLPNLPGTSKPQFRSHFLARSVSSPSLIYFDHNATSPLCSAAREAWLSAVERYPANPSSPHRLGSRAEAALNQARHAAAALLHCSPLDIVWTSGATEAINALFHHSSLDAPGEAWVSAIEHPSTLHAARKWFGRNLRFIPVSREGVVDLQWLDRELRQKKPSIVAIMAANNETGVLQPWREARDLCASLQVPFACDAAQWIGKLPARDLGACAFVTGCAHKFGGPVGIGFMKVPGAFRPLIVGGEQEDGRRAGTENLPAVLAMMAAWEQREKKIAAGELTGKQRLRADFIQQLGSSLPAAQPLGASAPCLWNTVSVLMPPAADCRRRWIVTLDKLGFAVSTGSACASGKEKPSHVVTAMGYEASEAGRMLRFSSGWETPLDHWTRLADALKAAAGSLAG